jgi:hypothetical protein
MQFKDEISLVPAIMPLVKNLVLANVKVVDPLGTGQTVEYFTRINRCGFCFLLS